MGRLLPPRATADALLVSLAWCTAALASAGFWRWRRAVDSESVQEAWRCISVTILVWQLRTGRFWPEVDPAMIVEFAADAQGLAMDYSDHSDITFGGIVVLEYAMLLALSLGMQFARARFFGVATTTSVYFQRIATTQMTTTLCYALRTRSEMTPWKF